MSFTALYLTLFIYAHLLSLTSQLLSPLQVCSTVVSSGKEVAAMKYACTKKEKEYKILEV